MAVIEAKAVDMDSIRTKLTAKRWIVITEDELEARQIAGGIYNGVNKRVYRLGDWDV